MAGNPPEAYPSDDFLDQILSIPSYAGIAGADGGSTSETTSLNEGVSQLGEDGAAGSFHRPPPMFPLSLSLDSGGDAVKDSGAFGMKPQREVVNNDAGSLYPAFNHLQAHALRHPFPQVQQAFHGQPTPSTAVTLPHPPGIRPRVRARRGQATDPHSIAERLRRERISERIKALQELVPSCNKTDRAAMLDEILDYVKFLRLQVKVLSMSRLGGAGAVAQLVADVPLQPIEGETGEVGPNQQVWEKWSDEETELEVAKLMEEDMGAAMQFLQSKSLCIMPVSLAALVYPTNQSDIDSALVKPEPSAPS